MVNLTLKVEDKVAEEIKSGDKILVLAGKDELENVDGGKKNIVALKGMQGNSDSPDVAAGKKYIELDATYPEFDSETNRPTSNF